jgi:hypothetical protein
MVRDIMVCSLSKHIVIDWSRVRDARRWLFASVSHSPFDQAHRSIDTDTMAQSTQISVSEPTFENAMPHSPTLAAKRSHDQIEPVADAPAIKKVKTNDDTLDANVLQDTKMQDVHDALAVLDDGVKESDAASGRSAWCMSFGEL